MCIESLKNPQPVIAYLVVHHVSAIPVNFPKKARSIQRQPKAIITQSRRPTSLTSPTPSCDSICVCVCVSVSLCRRLSAARASAFLFLYTPAPTVQQSRPSNCHSLHETQPEAHPDTLYIVFLPWLLSLAHQVEKTSCSDSNGRHNHLGQIRSFTRGGRKIEAEQTHLDLGLVVRSE